MVESGLDSARRRSGALSLYVQLCGASIRSQLSYRTSFLLGALGSFLVSGVEAAGIWVLFDRFDNLRGWGLAEVALMYGQINVGMAIGDALATGFNLVPAQIRSGDFDRVLLRPRASALLILGREVALRRVGRLLQGLLVLGWATAVLDLPAASLLLLLWAIVGAAALFLGLFVVQAAAAFWTVDSLEVFNAFSYGGSYAAQYPMTIYARWFRWLFTYLVPLALVGYFPVVGVLGRVDPLGSSLAFQIAAPVAGPAFLLLALGFWRLGVRHYSSTGS